MPLKGGQVNLISKQCIKNKKNLIILNYLLLDFVGLIHLERKQNKNKLFWKVKVFELIENESFVRAMLILVGVLIE